MTKKVCIIGAGPSGLCVLSWFAKMKKEGKNVPEVVCYEKQSNWGGLWNYTWRTGADQHGDYVHGSQYRYLWSNSPKECLEFPQYTFEDHFGKPIPSFPPRDVMVDYLNGRWNKEGLRSFVKFNHAVRDVAYNGDTDDFTVSVKSLESDKLLDDQKFDYVVVATGHFSVPNVPHFEGIEKFAGRVMHSTDFRDANEFKGKRILCIGGSYSAEDIAMQTLKYGAQSIICSWRSKPMGFKWPAQISERPLVQNFSGNTAYFKDGSTAEVDVVILCTGYVHHYPYLRDNLRLTGKNVLYPPGLYKSVVWQAGGNNKLLYAGVQDQCYSFTMFDVVGCWIVKYIKGQISLPDSSTREADWKSWVERNMAIKNFHEEIDYQTEYVADLVKDCGEDYPYNLDVSDMFHEWKNHKDEDVMTYRDKAFTCKFTGTKNPVHHTPFMKAMDDSLQAYVGL